LETRLDFPILFFSSLIGLASTGAISALAISFSLVQPTHERPQRGPLENAPIRTRLPAIFTIASYVTSF